MDETDAQDVTHSRRGKPVAWRRDPEIMDRLPKVERLHLRGDTTRAIAAAVGISEITVRRDIQRLNELWVEHIQQDQEALRSQVVANLEDVRRRALNAAEFDEAAERAVLYGQTADGEYVMVERDQKGSAQFRGNKAAAINVARQAAMDQAKVLGLVVDKVAPTDADGKTLDLASLILKARDDAKRDG
jgi:hypothetical protein